MTRTSLQAVRFLEQQQRRARTRRKIALLTLLAGAVAAYIAASPCEKIPRNTSRLTGQGWVQELLLGHQTRFYDNMGLNRHVFRHLLQALISKAGQGDTRHVTLQEQLAIFLYFS